MKIYAIIHKRFLLRTQSVRERTNLLIRETVLENVNKIVGNTALWIQLSPFAHLL